MFLLVQSNNGVFNLIGKQTFIVVYNRLKTDRELLFKKLE